MKRCVWMLLFLAGCQRAPIIIVSEAPPAAPPSLIGGGSDVGSGGDNLAKDHLAAWFVGKSKVIQACVETGPNFGVEGSEAKQTIVEAFLHWKKYIGIHHVLADQPPNMQLATEVEVKVGCDGSSEISFYLGVENEAVKKAKGQFDNPTAFVQRVSFEAAIPLGKGFIWVSPQEGVRRGFPDWKKEGRLLTILIHEIGHVMGNDHVPGTIMREKISSLMEGDWAGEYLASIDHCRELAPCQDCDYGTTLHPQSFDGEKRIFLTKVLGAKAKGSLTMKLSRTGGYGSFMGLGLQEDDNLSTHSRYILANRNTRPYSSSGATTFKTFIDGKITSGADASLIQYSTIYQNKDGVLDQVGMLIIEYNMASCPGGWIDNRFPVEVSYVEDNEQKPLGSFGDLWTRGANKTVFPSFENKPQN